MSEETKVEKAELTAQEAVDAIQEANAEKKKEKPEPTTVKIDPVDELALVKIEKDFLQAQAQIAQLSSQQQMLRNAYDSKVKELAERHHLKLGTYVYDSNAGEFKLQERPLTVRR